MVFSATPQIINNFEPIRDFTVCTCTSSFCSGLRMTFLFRFFVIVSLNYPVHNLVVASDLNYKTSSDNALMNKLLCSIESNASFI